MRRWTPECGGAISGVFVRLVVASYRAISLNYSATLMKPGSIWADSLVLIATSLKRIVQSDKAGSCRQCSQAKTVRLRFTKREGFTGSMGRTNRAGESSEIALSLAAWQLAFLQHFLPFEAYLQNRFSVIEFNPHQLSHQSLRQSTAFDHMSWTWNGENIFISVEMRKESLCRYGHLYWNG